MKVIPIQSCCAGVQFIDFPGAHYEGSKSDKQTVIELFELMYSHKCHSFFHAFVNSTQDRQMKKIFQALGWAKHGCGTRVTLYVHEGPLEWFRQNGLTTICYPLSPECPIYKSHNDLAREQWKTSEPSRENIVKALAGLGVELKDLPSLKIYLASETEKPKPERVSVKKPKLSATTTGVDEDAPIQDDKFPNVKIGLPPAFRKLVVSLDHS